jgi:hypothetical protein
MRAGAERKNNDVTHGDLIYSLTGIVDQRRYAGVSKMMSEKSEYYILVMKSRLRNLATDGDVAPR